MNVNTGERLGNYSLIQRLGVGGFSTVFLGEHLYLKTSAAVKVLHARIFNEEALTSFLGEARLVAQLHHPHIVQVLDVGVEEHAPYLVLQYAPNGTVRQRYPKGSRIPLPTIVQYVKQIAEALQYAHEFKIIHRDIKPENFLLGKDDEILLGDFGLAIPSQSSIGLSDHERAGTAVYMAPEQTQGKSSRASDQYALGVVVYEWLCGYPPFRGTEYEIVQQHIYAPPLPLHEVVPSVPAAIEQVVMRVLEKEPSERFPQVRDFAQALEAAYHQSQAQQNEASLATVRHDNAGDGQQQVEHATDSGFLLDRPIRDRGNAVPTQPVRHATDSGLLPPPSVLLDEQTKADPSVQTRESTATQSVRQRRMSRRALVATGLVALVALGGSAAALYFSGSPKSTPAPSSLSRIPSPHLTGTTAKSSGGSATPSGGSATSQAGDPGRNGMGSPPPSNQGTATGTTTTMMPLLVQIANANALAQVAANSNAIVRVTTSQPGILTTVQVAYSTGDVQTFDTLTTDGNGNASFLWPVPITIGLGNQVSVTLVAFAEDANGNIISSAPVSSAIIPADCC